MKCHLKKATNIEVNFVFSERVLRECEYSTNKSFMELNVLLSCVLSLLIPLVCRCTNVIAKMLYLLMLKGWAQRWSIIQILMIYNWWCFRRYSREGSFVMRLIVMFIHLSFVMLTLMLVDWDVLIIMLHVTYIPLSRMLIATLLKYEYLYVFDGN